MGMMTEMWIHPKYSYKNDLNDIVILKLDKPVTTIEPAPYATDVFGDNHDFSGDDADAIVLGWGLVDEKGEGTMAKDLQLGNVRLVNTKSCGSDYKYKTSDITSHNVCSTSRTQTDSCAGDSGGPLVQKS